MNTKLISHKDRVDALISQMWKSGYLTISRKYGKYLPAPQPVGEFEVDAIGKYKRKYMIGIVLRDEELNNPKLLSKIKYLSSQNTKYTNEKVKLIIGVNQKNFQKLNEMINTLPTENKNQIQIYLLND